MQSIDFLIAGSGATYTHGKCGTGSGQGHTDTDLATPIGGARTVIDSKAEDAANQSKVIITFPAGTDTGSIEEVGLFSDLAGSTMLVYDDSISKTKAAEDSLEVTWTVTFNYAA